MKEITASELKQRLDKGDAIQVIDVREIHEVEICTIGALHIPMGEIMMRANEVNKEGDVVIHCRSGKRSASVINILEMQHGHTNLINLKGGILAWANDVDPSMEQY